MIAICNICTARVPIGQKSVFYKTLKMLGAAQSVFKCIKQKLALPH